MFKKIGLEGRLYRRRTFGSQDFSALLFTPSKRQNSQGEARHVTLEELNPTSLTPSELDAQLELDNTADVLRRVFLGPQAVFRSRSINQRMYNYHFKSIDKYQSYIENRYKNGIKDQEEELGNAGPQYYRLRGLPSALSMDLVRSQLRSCLAPEDFTIVTTAVMRHQMGPEILTNPSLQRILQKWLVDRLEPIRVLEFLSLFINRVEAAEQSLEIGIIWSALIAAAQSHCTTAMRKYLKMWHNRDSGPNHPMERLTFMELLEAFKFGLDNPIAGRTFNRNAALEVMFGFSDPTFHGTAPLMTSMDPEHWEAKMLWTKILVKLNAGEHVWETWKTVGERGENVWYYWARKLVNSEREQWEVYAPRFFMHCLFETGQPERAWEIFRRAGRGILSRDNDTWNLLFKTAHLKGVVDTNMDSTVRKKFLRILSSELSLIEKSLGLEWKAPQEGDLDGYHVAVGFDRALEGLSHYGIEVRDPSRPFPPQTQVEDKVFHMPGKIFHNPSKRMSKYNRKLKQSKENNTKNPVRGIIP